MDRVREAYRLIVVSSLTAGIIATLLFIFAPQLIIGIFGKEGGLYMDFAVTSFRLSLGLCFVTCFIKISSIFFQAIGKAGHAMVASVIRDMFCFVIFTITFCSIFESRTPGTGIYGILLAAPVSDFVAGLVILVLTIRFFRSGSNAAAEKSADTDIQFTHPGTIITIGRQHGTQGKQIGKLLASELGIPFYCKEITALVAKESGLAEEFLSKDYEDIDETYHRLYLSTEVGQQGLIAQEQVLRKIAEYGSCVIVGRAADYMLKDYPDVIRIFLSASPDLRIRNIQEMYGDDEETARNHMIRSDNARASYYRAVTGQEWGNPENYDFVLDAGEGKDKTVQDILSMTGMDHLLKK